ncbi:MAG: hypothetical protein FWD74_06795, partial [Actinomycetia bacterium]|nr:hypothetical protein [Actinomycetes bacterium]
MAAAPTYGGAPLGTAPCHVALPAVWKRAVEEGKLWSGIRSSAIPGAPTPEGTGVLYASDPAATENVTIAGKGGQRVEAVGAVEDPTGQGQYTHGAIDADHVAFGFLLTSGGAGSSDWVIYLGDRHTGELKAIARNPVDARGVALQSGWVEPILTGDYVYWLQPTPNPGPWGGNELMQYSIKTGKSRSLISGLIDAYVPYG